MRNGLKMLVAVLVCAASPLLLAQTYPAKPIRMIVPFPGAALNDAIARAVSQSLSQSWGQPIVVENRAGANGNIGTDVCVKAAPDGYTVCMPTGVRFTHIPYKGSQQLQMAVAAGEVHVTTNTPGGIRANLEAGKVRPLAVVAGRGRAKGLPDVPTFFEQGYDLDFRNWVAIFLPRNAPLELARRWNVDVNKLLADPQYVEKHLGPWSVTAVGGTIDEFVNFMKRDRTMAGDLARIANLKLD